MRRNLYIPEEVRTAIRRHLEENVRRAVSGYSSCSEDEDTVTGDLGASLRTGPHKVFVPKSIAEIPGEWAWFITYYKFRGRGPKATESYVGADGIFELDLQIGSHRDQKSLLFQSKVTGRDSGDLLDQAIKLSTWREAAFILVFSESAYKAIPLDQVIRASGKIPPASGQPLDEYLGSDFLDCKVGDTELQYDSRRRRLIWRAMSGEIVATAFMVKHRFSIDIAAPQVGKPAAGAGREVSPEQIHNFRMQASDDDVLSLTGGEELERVRAAQKALARTYHPDRFNALDKDLKELLNRRMQEVNSAADRLKDIRRRGR